MDEQAGLENRSPSRDRGFESHPLRHHVKSRAIQSGATASTNCRKSGGGIRTGVLKGVCPLQGVTGATRRREGADPLAGARSLSGRLRMPTPSASRTPAWKP